MHSRSIYVQIHRREAGDVKYIQHAYLLSLFSCSFFLKKRGDIMKEIFRVKIELSSVELN